MPQPYIAPGTPVKVTVYGTWDGYANGTQALISIPREPGATCPKDHRKWEVPKGATVRTKPALAASLGAAEEIYVIGDHEPLADWEKELLLQETDITDTGEPLDTEKIPERFQCTRCDDSGGEYCAEHTYWSTRNAEFQRFWREYWAHNETVPEWAKDTPRKPEPQIGDTVAVALDEENGSTVVGILSATYDDKFWIEGDDFDLQVPHQGSQITVIEPARPAVPEDPKRPVYTVGNHSGIHILWKYNAGAYSSEPDPHPMSWDELWTWAWQADHTVYEATYERGPVIG